MQRTFTVELTAAEALTMHRMARLSRIPVERIVQSFIQAGVLSVLVSLSTGIWHWYDERSRSWVRNPQQDREKFAEMTANLVRGAGIEPPPRKLVQALSFIAPQQV